MRKLRNIISWILVFALCFGELAPATAVYAAETDAEAAEALEEAAADEGQEAVSEDETAGADEEATGEAVPEEQALEDEAAGDEAAEESVSDDAAKDEAAESVSEDAAAEESVSEDAAEEETVSGNETADPVKEEEPDEGEAGKGSEGRAEGYTDGVISDEDIAVDEGEDLGAEDIRSIDFEFVISQSGCREAGVLINQARKDGGVKVLTYDYGLEELACQRAEEASIYFSNTRPDGRDFSTIFNGNVNADGKPKKEILIRGNNPDDEDNPIDNATAAFDYFKGTYPGLLTDTQYSYIAVGHCVFDNIHYWSVELTSAVTNTNYRDPKKETQKRTIKIKRSYIKELGVATSLNNNSQINLNKGKASALPTFSAYIVTTSHRPDGKKLASVMPVYEWKLKDTTFGTINNNKTNKASLTPTAEEGTDSSISTTISHAGEKFTFTYKLHIIKHVTKIELTIEYWDSEHSSAKPDSEIPVTVKVLPADADNLNYSITSANTKVATIKKDSSGQYKIYAAGVGKTTITAVPVDNYNNVRDTKEFVVEGVQEVMMPLGDPEPYGAAVGKDQPIRLYTATPDAEIWYLTYGDIYFDEESQGYLNPPEEQRKWNADFVKNEEDRALFTLYTGPITISENTYIKALARKKSKVEDKYVYSYDTIFYYEYVDEGWGDICEEDRAQWVTPDKVPDGFWVAKASFPDLVYNGKAQRPTSFRVYNNKKLLTNKEYSISYKNNTNASTSANAIFKFKSGYSGQLERYFTIKPADLTIAQVGNAGVVYNGKVVDPKPTVTLGGRRLRRDVDYNITCFDTIQEPGDYTIYICGTGNYTGVLEHSYLVTDNRKEKPIPKAETLTGIASIAKIDVLPDYNYTGEAKTPEPTLIAKKKNTEIDLVKDRDYTVSYTNNVKAGTARVTVTGLESAGYKGSISRTFKIKKVSFKDATKDPANVRLNVDYTEYFNLYRKGGGVVDYLEVSIVIDGHTYQLKENEDFTVRYYNNKSADAATKKGAYFTLQGKGNFCDRSMVNYPFRMYCQAITSLNGSAPDKEYREKANNYKVTPVITDLNGKKLSAGVDYDRDMKYRYDEDVRVYNTKTKSYEDREAMEGIDNYDLIPAGTALQIAVNGKGNYIGTIIIPYKISATNISGYKAVIADKQYTGKEITLKNTDIIIQKGGSRLEPTDFEIIGYANNIAAGTAKVVVRGIGNYGGTATFRFKITRLPADNWIAGWKGVFGDSAITE